MHVDDCPVRYGRAVYMSVMIMLYTVGTHQFTGMIVLLSTGGIVSVCDGCPAAYRSYWKYV